MKKCFLIGAIVLSLLLFQGCSGSKSTDNEASKVVKTFMNSLSDGNFEDAYEKYEEMDESIDFAELKDNPMIDLLLSNLKYEITDSEINEDTATVTMKVTHLSTTEILKVLQQSMLDISTQIFDESNDIAEGIVTEGLEEVMGETQEKVNDAIDDAVEEQDEELETEESEVTVKLNLVDGNWVIDDESDLSIILGMGIE